MGELLLLRFPTTDPFLFYQKHSLPHVLRRYEDTSSDVVIEESDTEQGVATPTRVKSTNSRMYVETRVNGEKVMALVDTGAELTVLDENFTSKCIPESEWQESYTKCTSASGHGLPLTATASVEVTIGPVTQRHVVLIAKNLFMKMVLGDEFFTKLNVDVSYRQKNGKTRRQLYVEGRAVVTKGGNSRSTAGSICGLAFGYQRQIPARSTANVTMSVAQPGKIPPDIEEGELVLLEPIWARRSDLQIPRAITRMKCGTITMPVINIASVEVAVKVERFEPSIMDIQEIEPSIPKGVTKPDLAKLQTIKITAIKKEVERRMARDDPAPTIPGLDMSGSDLTENQKNRFMYALACIRDVFAENDADLGQTNLVKHDIDSGDAVPMRQRAYRMPFPKRGDMNELVSAKGIQPDPEKVSVIRDCTPPMDQHELRVFLGLVGFYRKFILNCAHITAPLTRLLQKEVEYKWTDECQLAFDTLKKHLTEEPLLVYPDLQKPYTLHTDASGLGVGCVLEQKGNDIKMHVIAYASRALKKHERNYSTTDWELLAIIWGMYYFRLYLLGNQNRIITDHSA